MPLFSVFSLFLDGTLRDCRNNKLWIDRVKTASKCQFFRLFCRSPVSNHSKWIQSKVHEITDLWIKLKLVKNQVAEINLRVYLPKIKYKVWLTWESTPELYFSWYLCVHKYYTQVFLAKSSVDLQGDRISIHIAFDHSQIYDQSETPVEACRQRIFTLDVIFCHISTFGTKAYKSIIT